MNMGMHSQRGRSVLVRVTLRCCPSVAWARLERMPRDPKQEIIVAIAGPAVNVAIAIVLAIGLLCVHGIRYQAATEQNMFAFFLLKVNLALVGFNMIPAFPMDGGRVLRAVATMFTNYHRATFIAMRVGQVLRDHAWDGRLLLLRNDVQSADRGVYSVGWRNGVSASRYRIESA